MNQECKTLSGVIQLSYSEGNGGKPITVTISESDRDTFMLVARQVSSVTGKDEKKNLGVNDYFRVNSANEHVDSEKFIDDVVRSTGKEDSNEEAATMSGMSREELQAHLDKNKAEVSAIASELRGEMEKWSKDNSEKISQLTISINALTANIEGKTEATNGRLEGVQGQMNGMNTAITGVSTAISGIQSGLSTKLTIFGVIITVVIALVGFGASLISSNASKLQPEATQMQPIIIQVPQAPHVPSTQPVIPKSSN